MHSLAAALLCCVITKVALATIYPTHTHAHTHTHTHSNSYPLPTTAASLTPLMQALLVDGNACQATDL